MNYCRTILTLGFNLLIVSSAKADEVLGCGGFVKSEIDIKYSDVEVKLFTKQGSLKDKTECAPNNGYYFLPVYDRGDYILKISPPVGWSFEPNEVQLNIDGETDACSLGKDINFYFKGFAVLGKVVSAGQDKGPAGVRVSLLPDTKKTDLSVYETLTTAGGNFEFTPVIPGKYTLQAYHPKWEINPSKIAVILKNGNVEVPANSLIVSGYDVSGTVTSDDEPIKGVTFFLYEQGKDVKKQPLIEIKSNEKGQFMFQSLAPGKYRVVPHYEGPQNIKFDVSPAFVDFNVEHDSVHIATPFQVKGFSVSGHILFSPNGKGIPEATVLLDGIRKSITSPDGSYHLENMQAGSYRLQIEAENVKFSDRIIKITPNTPQLENFYPSEFKICGTVSPFVPISGIPMKVSRQVHVRLDGGSHPLVLEVEQNSGEFCGFLVPGKYQISVSVTEEERSKGLQFAPLFQAIEIKDQPILSGMIFSQLKVELQGKLKCMPDAKCEDIPIILTSVPLNNNNSRVPMGITIAQDENYKFTDILPGKYEVSVDKQEWCWEQSSHLVVVDTAYAVVPTFKQIGYTIMVVSSHNTKIACKLENSGSIHTLDVTAGTSSSCVNSPGKYEITPQGCHSYAKPKFYWSTSSSQPVVLTAIGHTVGGQVVVTEAVDDITITVWKNSPDKELKTKLGPLKLKGTSKGLYTYKFELIVPEGEQIIFEPSASVLLFSPNQYMLTAPKDCVDLAVEFKAERGIVVSGKILPPLAAVIIKVSVVGEDNYIAKGKTQADGSFKFGPLMGGRKYHVSAEKEGFVLTGPDSAGNFHAHKLAEVTVQVVDKADNKPLQGVLLSLSGGESFRRNSQTGPDGKMTFSSLSPSEYYLRPMMKEYKFEPSSKMITVQEGVTVDVLLEGSQIAFSAYGTITSLSGEPEESVIVEAIGLGSCAHYQEESSSETNGQFRIRGLQPNCEYQVRVKPQQTVNQHIQRSTPDGILVKVIAADITGLHLIIFHPITQMDLTALVKSNPAEHLRTLRVKLFREDAPDSPVHIVKLDQPSQSGSAMVMFPPIVADGKSYFLQLESSLSRTSYTYKTRAVHFHANSSFRNIHLTFTPETKVIDQELTHSSHMVLPVILLLVLLYFNRQKISPLANRFAQILNGSVVANNNSNNGRVMLSNSDHNVADAVMVEPVLRNRKIKPRKT